MSMTTAGQLLAGVLPGLPLTPIIATFRLENEDDYEYEF